MIILTRIIAGEEKEQKKFTTREEALKFLWESRKSDTNEDYWVEKLIT